MSQSTRILLIALRISMGILFFYAGLTKIIDPTWSAAGYLQNAQTFSAFYDLLASPTHIGWVNFVNAWGLTALGVSLILGYLVRYSAIAGIGMLVLYYLPVLNFPYVGEHSFLVDQHIVYILALALLASQNAGSLWGLDKHKK